MSIQGWFSFVKTLTFWWIINANKRRLSHRSQNRCLRAKNVLVWFTPSQWDIYVLFWGKKGNFQIDFPKGLWSLSSEAEIPSSSPVRKGKKCTFNVNTYKYTFFCQSQRSGRTFASKPKVVSSSTRLELYFSKSDLLKAIFKTFF